MSTELEFAKALHVRGLDALAPAPAPPPSPVANSDVQNLKEVIRSWRELNSEVSELNAQLREKKKRQKALNEVILRTMKTNTIGALDLTGSGGRIIYRQQTKKGSLNIKTIGELLSQHLKSQEEAEKALKFMLEHRGGKLCESILYEKP